MTKRSPGPNSGGQRATASDRIEISAENLTDFAAQVLMALSVPPKAAHTVAEALVAADLEDLESHGVMLLPMYADRLAAGSVSPTSEGTVVSDRGGAVVIDAENALGQVTSERAVELAVERAKVHGLSAVTVRNGFHFGAAGRWAKAMAGAGCIGVALCNTRPLMPAPGGAERVVGNNPIAVAVPTAGASPTTLDIALSAGAMGKIRLAEAAGERIPEGWACDASGVPTTDAAAAVRGMLLPIGGAKGFGLAMIVDLLAGGLSSGAMGGEVQPLYGDPAVPYRCAHFFLALEVSAFRDVGDYAAAAAEVAARIRQSRPAPGGPPVRVPGDRTPVAAARNAGMCCIPASVAAALRTTAQRFGIAPPPALL